jgi:hypothetical protein
MRQRLRPPRPSHATIVAYLALFVALGGTGAWATHEVINSSDVVDESLRGVDIRGKDGTSTTAGVNGALTGADISGQPAIAAVGQPFVQGSLTTSDIKDNSLIGADVNEGTLAGLDAADGFNTFCDPNSMTFVNCGAAATVTLGRAMSVLVMVTSHFSSFFGNPPNVGNCRLMENGVAVSGDHTIGELDPDRDTGLDASGGVTQGGMNLVDVRSLAAGTYTFRVDCNETASDIAFNNISVAAVELAQD